MAKDRPTLLAVDGTALAFRAFFAIRGLTDELGRPSGALYGYLASLLRAIEELPHDHVVVAWDRPEPTFRAEIDPEYKANREELDEDLALQFPWLREATELLGIRSMDRPRFEADDILASLAAQGLERGWEVELYSSDKDLAQVVAPGVWQVPPPKQGQPMVKLGPAEIEEKYGLPPTRMAEWQALVGDSTDNIKGMPGVGAKRATTLLGKYPSLEELLDRGPEEEKGKLAENLGAHRAQVERALELVTMRTDLEFEDLEGIGGVDPDFDGLEAFCTEHSLNTLGRRFKAWRKDEEAKAAAARETPSLFAEGGDGSEPEEKPPTASELRYQEGAYRLVRTAAELDELCAGLEASGGFAFDTETTSLDPMRAELVGMSFAWVDEEAWYAAMNLEDAPPELAPEALLARLKPLLEDPALPKVGQNFKYDAKVMLRHGVEVAGWSFDPMLAHFLTQPTSAHNLDALSLHYLDLVKIETKELLGTGRKAVTMDQVDVDRVATYACEDADATWRLVAPLEAELDQTGTRKLFEEVELPLAEVLVRMEARGIRVDRERLARMQEELAARRDEAAATVYEASGQEFNLNSPKQLGPVLFEDLRIQDELGVKRVGRTKTGYRTDAATLDRYRGLPVVDALLEYRQLSKLIGTYVEALPEYIHPETGCIHTSFHQAVAATGRLSSSDPNLQNIPIRSEAGRAIRRAFVPREEGWSMVSADYSQVELRVVAHLSGDEALCEAFRAGADVHAATAALVFEADPTEVDPTMRARAKAINFGILYGMGPQRLARETGLSMAEAKDFIAQYFAKMPKVRGWLDDTLEQGRETGEVRTLLGRRRPVPELASSDGRVRAAAENMAVNTPVQGSAADLIKLAMLKVDAALRASDLQAAMLLQVHDELVFECPESERPALEELVRREMEGAYPLDVPLKVDIGHGPDWATAH
jgi:DNA polymerase-1